MKTIISEISKTYAKSLAEISTEQNCDELYLKQLYEISEIFNKSKDLTVVMSNTSISLNKKLEIIDSIFKSKIDKKLLNFIKLIIEKRRFNEFDSIVESYSNMIDKKSGKKKVEIISPIALSFENKSNVLFKLEHKLKCEIIPTWTIDESIIAGLVFKFDDYVIDTSIRAKLKNFSKVINR
jgi:F-type H+-transporting ATPase subunit delta